MDFTDTARAPMQAGDITTTALAALALSRYGPSAEATSTQERLSRARDLLLGAEPQTTDDLAFRLLGLKWTAAAAEQQAAADRLRAAQRSGGGWAQQANMPPDAYATGLSLFALHEGGMAVSEPAWRAGLAFLIQSQQPDGSWFVKTRAIPSNPYFESGFPHGKSQFISYAATCWSTLTLTLALPAASSPGE